MFCSLYIYYYYSNCLLSELLLRMTDSEMWLEVIKHVWGQHLISHYLRYNAAANKLEPRREFMCGQCFQIHNRYVLDLESSVKALDKV